MVLVEDEMQNEWGTVLVNNVSKPARKSFHDFDKEVRSDVPGFALYGVLSAGTYVNMAALQEASDYELNCCLFGIGNYIGGDKFLQQMSTSEYDASSSLAAPKDPEDVTQRCLAQTVPLPYWVDCTKFNDKKREELENECLRALHTKLLVAKLSGPPYKVLLLEYILGGNGGELSHRFLKQLGRLLIKFNVTVVADEVLTGGRVGPQMFMTPTMPQEFQDCVSYITAGKFMKCALLLKKIPKRPTDVGERSRGTSTTHDVGEAFTIWRTVKKCQLNGSIKTKQREVLAKMNVSSKAEDWWGKGLLLFSTYTRNPIITGIKNRMLPTMEKSKIVKGHGTKRSRWNRSTVCDLLREQTKRWIAAQEKAYEKHKDHAFVVVLVHFCFEGKCDVSDGYFQFRSEDVMEHLGVARAAMLAGLVPRSPGARRREVKALTLVRNAILFAQHNNNNPESPIIYKKRKNSSRKEYTFLDAELFGTGFNEKGSKKRQRVSPVFWS